MGRSRPEAKLEIVGPIGFKTYISWGTNKSNSKLNFYLNNQIEHLEANGSLKNLQQKYFFGITFAHLPDSNFIPKA